MQLVHRSKHGVHLDGDPSIHFASVYAAQASLSSLPHTGGTDMHSVGRVVPMAPPPFFISNNITDDGAAPYERDGPLCSTRRAFSAQLGRQRRLIAAVEFSFVDGDKGDAVC